MRNKIIFTILAILALLYKFIDHRPGEFRYTRSATIAASPSVLFGKVNDLHQFQAWNPWAKLDPASKVSHTGPEAGVGAAFTWSGNREVGEGTMTITESRQGELVRARMDFKKPMAATHTAEFTFKPEGDKTVVTWSMFGKNGFLGKAAGLVMDCDKMCGDQFTQGLENLRALTEKPGAK